MACGLCGCEGIHACIGHKPAPMTEEQKTALDRLFRNFDQDQQMIEELTVEQLTAIKKASGIDQSNVNNIDPF
jgi:hypothetical protein